MAAMQALALYDFDSQGPGELSIHAGETLSIIRQDVGEGWWEARNKRGQQGLVPEAYLELTTLPEPNFPPPPAPSGSAGYVSAAPAQSRTSFNSSSNAAPPSWGGAASHPPPSLQPSQDSYDDWDDDWDDDDDSSVTTETPDTGSVSNVSGVTKRKKEKDENKFGTVRKPFGRFSNFAKAGGEAYLFGSSSTQIAEVDQQAMVEYTPDGPIWQPKNPPFTCAITSPKKESKFHGMKSFTSYQLTPSFSNIQVSRRYKHFDWLHKILEDKFTTIVIPPLPDKQVTGRFEEDFIEGRMKQLQRWVDRLCRHPIICNSDVFMHFLSCTDEKKWKQGKRNSEKDDYQGGRWFLTVGVPPDRLDPTDTEVEFDKFARCVKGMDDSVRHLIHIGDSNAKKCMGPFKKEYQKLGGSFVALASSFEFDNRPAAQQLTRAIERTGRTYEEIGELYENQPYKDMLPMLEALQEYKGILGAFPDVLGVYRAATNKIGERAGSLNETEIQAVQRRADVIAYTTFAEMNHFHQYRLDDYKESIASFLQGQINFYREIAQKLEDSLHEF